MARVFTMILLTACLASIDPPVAHANNDSWKTATNGIWSTGTNWLDGSTPGNSDAATLLMAGAYTVTFNANPLAIQDLFVINSGTNVTLTSSGSARTLSANSAGGRARRTHL